jgi:hypothetical protein
MKVTVVLHLDINADGLCEDMGKIVDCAQAAISYSTAQEALQEALSPWGATLVVDRWKETEEI